MTEKFQYKHFVIVDVVVIEKSATSFRCEGSVKHGRV